MGAIVAERGCGAGGHATDNWEQWSAVALALVSAISWSHTSASFAGRTRAQASLVAHERKLREFKADPDAHDNAGLLARSPSERREKIIQGRIRKLERQIRNFRRQLAECERLHQRP
jgi:hypothetical protein